MIIDHHDQLASVSVTCPDLHVIILITCHMKQEPYHELNTDVVHRTIIIHMVSEHMERDSQRRFVLCRIKTFDLLWSSFAGLCCQAHISCTPHQLEDDFVQNTFPPSTNVHAW